MYTVNKCITYGRREETSNVPLVAKACLQCLCDKPSHYNINNYTDEYPIYNTIEFKTRLFLMSLPD